MDEKIKLSPGGQAYLQESFQKAGHNVSRLARETGLDFGALKEHFAPQLNYDPVVVRPTRPMPTDITTLGKPGMQQWVIAVKQNGDAWPHKFREVIYQARASVDAGTHIMCQGKRKDGWVIQYLIPRKTPLRKITPYFSERASVS